MTSGDTIGSWHMIVQPPPLSGQSQANPQNITVWTQDFLLISGPRVTFPKRTSTFRNSLTSWKAIIRDGLSVWPSMAIQRAMPIENLAQTICCIVPALVRVDDEGVHQKKTLDFECSARR